MGGRGWEGVVLLERAAGASAVCRGGPSQQPSPISWQEEEEQQQQQQEMEKEDALQCAPAAC